MTAIDRNGKNQDYVQSKMQEVANAYWQQTTPTSTQNIGKFHSRKITIYDQLTQDIRADNFAILPWFCHQEHPNALVALNMAPPTQINAQRRIVVFSDLPLNTIQEINALKPNTTKNLTLVPNTAQNRGLFFSFLEPTSKELNKWAERASGETRKIRRELQAYILAALENNSFLYTKEGKHLVLMLNIPCLKSEHKKNLIQLQQHFPQWLYDVNSFSCYSDRLIQWAQKAEDKNAIKERYDLYTTYLSNILQPQRFCSASVIRARLTFRVSISLPYTATTLQVEEIPRAKKHTSNIFLDVKTPTPFMGLEPLLSPQAESKARQNTQQGTKETALAIPLPEPSLITVQAKYRAIKNLVVQSLERLSLSTEQGRAAEYHNEMTLKKLTYYPVTPVLFTDETRGYQRHDSGQKRDKFS